MKVPRLLNYIFVISAYPTIYYAWVTQMKNTWINNDIKELHSQLIYPTANRFFNNSSPYDLSQEMRECLISQGKGLKQQYEEKISKKNYLLQKHDE